MNNQDVTYQLTLIIQCYFYVRLFSPLGSSPPFDTLERDKQVRSAATIDAINRKNGHNAIKVAVQDTSDKSWHLKCEHISKQYTTNLDEVIHVR